MNERIEHYGKHVVVHDNNKSGAMLAWEYFHPGTEVPMLIKHIDDYDRWQFKLIGTKAFNKALLSQAPWSFEQWRQILDWEINSPREFSQLYLEGAAILRAHDANVQAVVKGEGMKCSIVTVFGPCGGGGESGPIYYDGIFYDGLAANCPPHLASDVGHQLAAQAGTYGLLWYIDSEGKCKCSLRSNGDYDVSAIAKAFGGGGHKNAAGFTVDVKTLLGWLQPPPH